MRALGNLSPAVVEEVGFRASIVHLVAVVNGQVLGLASGSVPFGVLHLIGRLFGHPVDLMHVIGVSLAGLVLSITYLRFGVLAATGVHWVWNSLCGGWVDVLGLPQRGGVQLFEGAWTTSVVLLIVSVLLLILFRSREVVRVES